MESFEMLSASADFGELYRDEQDLRALTFLMTT